MKFLRFPADTAWKCGLASTPPPTPSADDDDELIVKWAFVSLRASRSFEARLDTLDPALDELALVGVVNGDGTSRVRSIIRVAEDDIGRG